MQPIDRDTQIMLMTDVETRLSDRLRAYLEIPEVAAAAKRCAFADSQPDVTFKRVTLKRRA